MADLHINPTISLNGNIQVPGDKSISHRSLLLGALGNGISNISGFLPGSDCLATLACLRSLGVIIDEHDQYLSVHGVGIYGLKQSTTSLNCVRSGTTMRLLTGLLTAQSFESTLTGEEQLLRRPMRRVTEPLGLMGALIHTKDGYAPIDIIGCPLHGIDYEMEVASAQVKSALILAGLYADGDTIIHQPGPTRDHTERMLNMMGASIETDGLKVYVNPCEKLSPLKSEEDGSYLVPGDISSAAFPLVAALLVPGSNITIENVGINPTRTGLIDVLQQMGAKISLNIADRDSSSSKGEPVSALTIEHSELKGVEVKGDVVVRMIDEFPVFAVAATQAHGTTVVHDAEELRVKETDRIAAVVQELKKLGANIEALPDGFVVEGPTPLQPAIVDSHNDHRLAMALSIAGLIASGEVVVNNVDWIGDSFPGYISLMQRLGARYT